MLDLLIALQRDLGLSYVFVSHDMAVVERIAHRISVIHAGQIVEIGSARAVLSDPRHPYTQKLIAAVPSIDQRRVDYAVETTEVPSLLRPVGYRVQPQLWRDCGPDHRVATLEEVS